MPAAALSDFVSSLAHRIARSPAAGHVTVKDRVNAIALAPAGDFRRDSDLFLEGVRRPEVQSRIGAALKHGFQTRDPELTLAGCWTTCLSDKREEHLGVFRKEAVRFRAEGGIDLSAWVFVPQGQDGPNAK